ncbi:MAG: ATP-dependent DNA helicase [archaeon]
MKVYFPFDTVRAEQSLLVSDIAKAIGEKKVFFAHAPTGLGKTVSSLAPALSYALENNLKVFFLTPKISQHEIVLQTANAMNEKFGLGIKTVDLVGRKQMCVEPFISRVPIGFYEACAKRKKDKACSYYNNTKGVTFKQKAIAAKRKRAIWQEYNKSYLWMKEQCRFKNLCPYEITTEMIKGANLIIGDYTHLFHSSIREGIIGPAELSLEEIIIVVDEAHNLPERLRDMMTISFDVSGAEKAEKEAKSVGDFETEFLIKDFAKEFLGLGKKLGLEKSESVLEEKDTMFLKRIAREGRERISDAADKFMTKNKTENCFLLALSEFLSELLKEKEHTLYTVERRGSLSITVQPLDPAELAIDVLSSVHSAVLMSGTLLPLQMYSDVLGATKLNNNEGMVTKTPHLTKLNLDKESNSIPKDSQKNSNQTDSKKTLEDNSSFPLTPTTAHELHKQQSQYAGHNIQEPKNLKVILKEYKSPFPKENKLNLMVNKTTTKYTSRNHAQFLEIAQEIDKIISKVPGNTIVFFPSFELLSNISILIKTSRKVLRQEREMSQDDKTKLVNEFKILGSRFGGVLLAVSGGSFAEGLDFPGDYLSCAIIVGIPFAKMNIYGNALINYYEYKFKKGWDYAYNAPAIGKAMQAAGRVIRTETDRGVCIFLDIRFGDEKYKRFFPKDFTSVETNNPTKEVEDFFGK